MQRGLIKSGQLQKLIYLGLSGLTSNPTIFEKTIAGSTDYDDAPLGLEQDVGDTGQIFETLALDDIRAAADLLRPIYDRTGGADGYASLEVSPYLSHDTEGTIEEARSHDTEGTIEEARRLLAALDRPNVMVKVPATPEGVPEIRALKGYPPSQEFSYLRRLSCKSA